MPERPNWLLLSMSMRLMTSRPRAIAAARAPSPFDVGGVACGLVAALVVWRVGRFTPLRLRGAATGIYR